VGRRFFRAFALGSVSVACWIVACGIDESGLSTGDASVGPDASDDVVVDVVLDVPVVDNYVPPPCTDPDATIDASCLGKPVPLGWIPVGIQEGVTTTCPGDGGDFTTEPYVEDPQLAPNACVCTGCAASGDWTCDYQLSAGSTCTSTTMDASASFCWSISHGSISAVATRSGSPTCGGGQQIGNGDAMATPVTTCVPTRCQSDYCSLGGQGYSLCVLNSQVSDGGCPADFPNSKVVGVSTVLGCAGCQTCGLANADAGCSAGFTAYSGANCDNTALGSGTSDGTCLMVNYASVYFDAAPPPVPNCGPSTGVTGGAAALVGPLTICCP
jgi:hypothetical protein